MAGKANNWNTTFPASIDNTSNEKGVNYDLETLAEGAQRDYLNCGKWKGTDNWKPIIRQSVIFKCRMRDTAEIPASRRCWRRNQG